MKYCHVYHDFGEMLVIGKFKHAIFQADNRAFLKLKTSVFLKTQSVIILSLILMLRVYSLQGFTSGEGHSYRNLSEEMMLSKVVWIETDQPEIGIEIARNSDFRGIYLKKPAETNLSSYKKITIALELTENITQEFNLEVPGLIAAESFSDERLFRDYALNLKNAGLKNGYDLMVIPSVDSIAFISRIGHKLNEIDPEYFRLKSDYIANPDPRRKSFHEELEGKMGVILTDDHLEEYERVLRKKPKYPEYLQDGIDDFLAWNKLEYDIVENPSERFVYEYWKHTVIPFRREAGTLPLNDQNIALWVEHEQQPLKQGLEKYFRSVYNLKFDQIPQDIPVIIDARTNPLLAAEFAYNYQSTNPVIWIGLKHEVLDINAAAYLLISEQNERLDHILSEMIYGSESVDGMMKGITPKFLSDMIPSPILSEYKLGISTPEWQGMNQETLDSLDLLAEEMIRQRGTPGAQVLIAKNGKVIFSKAYGYLTYDSLINVDEGTLYDLASLTKVSSTLLATMKLVDEGRIHLDSTLGHYLESYRDTNKEDISIRSILSHQSGLQSYIPFWKRSIRGDLFDAFYYRSDEDEANDVRSYGLQPDPILLDSLQSWIKTSNVSKDEDPEYLYSDIGFMIVHQIIETVLEESIEEYVRREFYLPIGMQQTVFNPLSKGYEIYQIAPTEYDYHFRQEQVWGTVHDRNAAIFGGVAGHAGLFANARDLAILIQMMLHDGQYGGYQFLSRNVLQEFNTPHFQGNRRGLGWDKPGRYNPNISEMASTNSFGHTGFTGTMVWADPDEDLIFVFLSNRIFPNSENRNLIRLDTRRRMHDIIYRSLLTSN